MWECVYYFRVFETIGTTVCLTEQRLKKVQVISRESGWIHTWSLLYHAEARELMLFGCNRWKTVARATYNLFGWRSNIRYVCRYVVLFLPVVAFRLVIITFTFSSCTSHLHTWFALINDCVHHASCDAKAGGTSFYGKKTKHIVISR